MAETLSTLSIISYVVAAVLLAVAVFLWFFLKIPVVIGELSGRTARKSIAKMREANEKSGTKGYRTGKMNKERGKVTETMKHSEKQKRNTEHGMVETGLLDENKSHELFTEVTGLLEEETASLGAETTGLLVDDNATAPLEGAVPKRVERTGGSGFKMLEDIMLIHTDEVIR